MGSVLADARKTARGAFIRPATSADEMISTALREATRLLSTAEPNPADRMRVKASCLQALQWHTAAVDRRRRSR